MFREHEQVVLTAEISSDAGDALMPGDVGVIVHTHPGDAAYVVEFFALDGRTAAIATVLPSQARSVTDADITHARSAT